MSDENPFEQLAPGYARYRPRYPEALFEYLASVAPSRELAWDCGTGSGQAAVGLARHFQRVIATDASPEQITHAAPHERVTYRVAPVHNSGLEPRSVHLATAAMALHWFDLDRFYPEVRRVLVPGGVFAAWSYKLAEVSPSVDAVTARYFHEVLGPYWSSRIQWVEEGYRSLPFPFEELDPPAFEMTASWSLEEFVGFLSTWSAVQAYRDARGGSPVEEVEDDLHRAWGPAERERRVVWPLHLRVGVIRPGKS